MKDTSALEKRRPVATYFVLAFAISWGGVVLVVGGPGAIPGGPDRFGAPLSAYSHVLAAELCIFVAAVAVANSGHPSRRPIRKRVV